MTASTLGVENRVTDFAGRSMTPKVDSSPEDDPGTDSCATDLDQQQV